MGWHEIMHELETKLEGTLKRIYRPLDNVPFFRVQYPPAEEREAISQFQSLTERFKQKGRIVDCVSLTEVCQKALATLQNCSVSELPECLKTLENQRDRQELQRLLFEHLPDELSKVIEDEFGAMPRESILILLRMGALYPFIRSSSLISRLEGKLKCLVVLPYPGTSLGALLDTPPADPHGGYYRGEIIGWR